LVGERTKGRNCTIVVLRQTERDMRPEVFANSLERTRLPETGGANECDARALAGRLQIGESGIHCCIDGLERRGRHGRTDEIARWT
jgi:hypothetical protein